MKGHDEGMDVEDDSEEEEPERSSIAMSDQLEYADGFDDKHCSGLHGADRERYCKQLVHDMRMSFLATPVRGMRQLGWIRLYWKAGVSSRTNGALCCAMLPHCVRAWMKHIRPA